MFDTRHAFKGEYFFLSNMYPVTFTCGGVTYNSSEQFYQSRKTIIESEFPIIVNCDSPLRSKTLGKKVTLRDDWDRVKDAVMFQALSYKFENPELRAKLLATDGMYLVEYNYWGDTYWGVCNGVGENKLGEMLMRLRDSIRFEVAHA